MKDHVARTVSRCFRQLRLLKGCIKSLPSEAARAAVAAFVASQVDRCNSLLVGAPKRLLDCLQSVLIAAARLLCNRIKYDRITALLRDVLHWLPVPLHVEFKICLLVYKSLHGAAHGYLREYCKETHLSALELRLRSTDKCDLHVRRMKTAPSQLLAPDPGTDFLLLCVRPARLILLKLDLRPIYSALLTRAVS